MIVAFFVFYDLLPDTTVDENDEMAFLEGKYVMRLS